MKTLQSLLYLWLVTNSVNLNAWSIFVFDVFPSDINLSDTLLKSSGDRTQIYHKFIEASKFAFALRSYVGDVDTAEVQEVSVDLACFYKPLKAVDTIGNYSK